MTKAGEWISPKTGKNSTLLLETGACSCLFLLLGEDKVMGWENPWQGTGIRWFLKSLPTQNILRLYIPSQDQSGKNGGWSGAKVGGEDLLNAKGHKNQNPVWCTGRRGGLQRCHQHRIKEHPEMEKTHKVHQNPAPGSAQHNSKVHTINNRN